MGEGALKMKMKSLQSLRERETMIKVSRKAPVLRCGELAGPREAPDGTAL